MALVTSMLNVPVNCGRRIFTLVPEFGPMVRNMERDIRRMEEDWANTKVFSMTGSDPIEAKTIVGENGEKKMQWSFACDGFKPEDIVVKTKNNMLEVQARSEEKGEHHSSVREFSRMVNIPEGCDVPKMTSALSNGGVLTVETPFVAPVEAEVEDVPEVKSIKIDHE